MNITGELLINGSSHMGKDGHFQAIEAATGKHLPGTFGGATVEDLAQATEAAWKAFPIYRETNLEKRAAFLEKIAELIAATGDELIARTMAETGLPKARLEGERMRTVNQLKMFAREVRSAHFIDRRDDPADLNRKPQPKPGLVFRNIGIGPVAVFGASNFPYAFSVAGGDTAAALAAGCPVIVKAHPAHPGTSEVIGRCVQQAVAACHMPAGTFALLQTTEPEIAQKLVADPHICAVGFTGSRKGGLVFMDIAAKRKQPIPVYAEMSSINPVLLLPGALEERGSEIGTSFINSLCMGAGQFCTNPGLVLAINGKGYDAFLNSAREATKAAVPQTMLTPNIAKAYRDGVERLENNAKVTTIARGKPGSEFECQAALFEVSASDFIKDHRLEEEVFGSSSLIVKCNDKHDLIKVLEALEGQLTIAIHLTNSDNALANELMPLLEIMAGRLLINGFGTGVEVSPAMVHGGPFPSTSDGRSTSVGTAAIYRFLRPVCYQDFSENILPSLLK